MRAVLVSGVECSATCNVCSIVLRNNLCCHMFLHITSVKQFFEDLIFYVQPSHEPISIEVSVLRCEFAP